MFDQSTHDAGGAHPPTQPPGPMRENAPYSIPWQNRDAYPSALRAMWETIKVVLFEPSRAFWNVQVQGALPRALVFVLILGSVGGIIAQVYNAAFQIGSQKMLFSLMGQAPPDMPGAEIAAVVGLVIGTILVPVAVVIGSFVASGVFHLMLMMLGANKNGFEATYCVVAYAQGATALLQVVPVMGGIVALVWQIVVCIIGLSYVHKITSGQAVAAVLVPMAFCCLAPILVMVGLVALPFVL
ncbi:MAG: Yip1 family protein [Candidatus Brocadiia bacterium]|jgi:hypothetical protein|nr:Yip1 family protein [Candidatus Brocadiia bacterium]